MNKNVLQTKALTLHIAITSLIDQAFMWKQTKAEELLMTGKADFNSSFTPKKTG